MSIKLIVVDSKSSMSALSQKLDALPYKKEDVSIVSIRIPSKASMFWILAVIGILFKYFNGHPRVLYSRLCDTASSIEITFFSSLSELLEETQI